MNFLFLGDIVGRAGRIAVIEKLPKIISDHKIDFVIANGENSAGGYGITPSICDELFKCGIDVITSGNHIWDQKEILNYIIKEKRLLRPFNFEDGTPGSGFEIYNKKNVKVGVMNIMGNIHMKKCNNVFEIIEKKISEIKLKTHVDFLLIDFHAELTSEKQAMGHLLDGKATLVVGTHTHTPTLDYRILDKGTAFQTDAGMCGDYNSVIGMKKENAILRFFKKKTDRLPPAMEASTIYAIIVEGNADNGLPKNIYPILTGGNLKYKS